jgi:hypothetical protein
MCIDSLLTVQVFSFLIGITPCRGYIYGDALYKTNKVIEPNVKLEST